VGVFCRRGVFAWMLTGRLAVEHIPPSHPVAPAASISLLFDLIRIIPSLSVAPLDFIVQYKQSYKVNSTVLRETYPKNLMAQSTLYRLQPQDEIETAIIGIL